MHFRFGGSRAANWSFQQEAIAAVTRDFTQSPRGRFLLVVPTGGGKTLTAFRTIDSLQKKGLIKAGQKVLWIVHTIALKTHAQDLLESDKTYRDFSLGLTLRETISVQMKAEATKSLQKKNNFVLLVIDEAHHAAAATYSEFFDYPVGILGLTATPRRMDAKELPFSKVSYSITFRELVRRRVVLLPQFLPEARTNLTIKASALDDPEQLETFDTDERNSLVANLIFKEAQHHDLKKIVVFAATNAHVGRLCEALRKLNESSHLFEHVGFINSGGNEKGIANENYLRWHKTQASSLLVNCRLLNEGYDDPHIDTVVMAAPTASILYYMQCIGRVVRNPEDSPEAKAHVIEIVDNLPNVSYRIDNRWLFAEISDYLEPCVYDVNCPRFLRGLAVYFKLLFIKPKSSDNFFTRFLFTNLWDLTWKERVSILKGDRINLLLFNDAPHNRHGQWRVLTLPEDDLNKMRFFNVFSENIEDIYSKSYEFIFERDYPSYLTNHPIRSRAYRAAFISALNRAYQLKVAKKPVDSLIYISVR